MLPSTVILLCNCVHRGSLNHWNNVLEFSRRLPLQEKVEIHGCTVKVVSLHMKSVLYSSNYRMNEIDGFVTDHSHYIPKHDVVQATPFSLRIAPVEESISPSPHDISHMTMLETLVLRCNVYLLQSFD